MTGKCFVAGCNSGLQFVRRQCKKENKKHPRLFSAPKNSTMLQIWKHVIPESDKEFCETDKICELHFTEDCIAKFHEFNFEDGEQLKLERNLPKLKPGAIPTVFSAFPKYSENVKKIVNQMCKAFPLHVPQMNVKLDDQMESYLKIISEVREMSMFPIEEMYEAEQSSSSSQAVVCKIEEIKSVRNVIPSTENITFCDEELDAENRNESDVDVTENRNESAIDVDLNECVNVKNTNSDLMDVEIQERDSSKVSEITFQELVKNVKSISKPNSSWSVTSHGKFVMCAKWNKEYQPEKRVVIDTNLNIKVFLDDEEIAAYNNCIGDISDVSNVLSVLDK